MSFKIFIYYCALCGGWAAFVAWMLAQGTGLPHLHNDFLASLLTGGLLGVILSGTVGGLDALFNASAGQRLVRMLICAGIGLLGGMLGALVGESLYRVLSLRFPGWVLVGLSVGAAAGVFDVLQAWKAGQAARGAWKKVRNGVYGGLLGGAVGGLVFEVLKGLLATLPRTSLALGFVLLGLCIGLFIGLAQVILKEAWLRVESGFRAGRELLLTKNEITIGRGEGCDLGLFGDNSIERLHARILLRDNHYVLADAQTPGGTFLNEQAIAEPTPLRSGDTIRLGNSVLRFGERRKKKG